MHNMGILLVSLNVERKRHIDLIVPFIRQVKPDVVCLQEVCLSEIPVLKEYFEATDSHYAPVTIQRELMGEMNEHGISILSRFPMTRKDVQYYVGNASNLPVSDETIVETFTSGQNRMVVFGSIETPEGEYRVGTTHFTWTPRGEVNEAQRRDLKSLLSILDSESEFVLAGDFNAPRGGEIFSAIAARYRDNIPLKYRTSLDMQMHRAAKKRSHEIKNKMVDGLFTTPAYVASNVSLVAGLSDHCAIVSMIAISGQFRDNSMFL